MLRACWVGFAHVHACALVMFFVLLVSQSVGLVTWFPFPLGRSFSLSLSLSLFLSFFLSLFLLSFLGLSSPPQHCALIEESNQT